MANDMTFDEILPPNYSQSDNASAAAPAPANGEGFMIETVSWFNGVRWKPELGDKVFYSTFRKIVERLRSEEMQERIEKLRGLDKTSEGYQRFKKSLPAFTPAGKFSGREDSDFEQFSGFIHFDIDHFESSQALTSFKFALREDTAVAWYFVSPSGDGLKGAVYSDSNITTPGEYSKAWLAVARYFQERYEIVIDPKCKNVSRLCFLSFDFDLYVNPNAQFFDLDKWAVSEARPAPEKKKFAGAHSAKKWTREEVEKLCLAGKWRIKSDRQVLELDECPWSEAHTTGKGGASIAVYETGAISFYCQHSHCEGRDWDALKDFLGISTKQNQDGIPLPTDEDLAANTNEKSSHNLTDLGNAIKFVEGYCEDVLFIADRRRYYVWNGKTWSNEKSEAHVSSRVRQMLRDMFEASYDLEKAMRARMIKHVFSSESNNAISAITRLASSDIRIVRTQQDFDTNPMLLNVENGTLDLATGEFYKARKSDMLSQMAAVEYDKFVPLSGSLFESFLNDVFLGRADIIESMQTAFGYSLTGKVNEHVLFFLHGQGSNGKSTLMNLFQGLLGDYATSAPPEMLMLKKFDDHLTEIASLHGRRFVSAVETSTTRSFNESRLKILTGGDRISARRMREDHFTFTPTHKFWIAGNHKPKIQNTDDGIWRRLFIIPFDAKFGNGGKPLDKSLDLKLQAEKSVVLNWGLEGVRKWLDRGEIPRAEAIAEAINEYRSQMDIVQTWIEENCLRDGTFSTPCKKLFADFDSWCRNSGERASNQVWFSRQLARLGFDSKRTANGSLIIGLGIRSTGEQTGDFPQNQNSGVSEWMPF